MEWEKQESFRHPYEEEESIRLSKVHELQENISLYQIKAFDPILNCGAENPSREAAEHFKYSEKELAPTFYLVPELAEFASEGISGFTPYTSRSGNSSYHGVFFGEIHFADGSSISVAVKPHDIEEDNNYTANEESCLNDYFANLAAKELGFESLKPVGLILDYEGTQYSITKLEEDLDTLDMLDWTDFYKEGFKNYGMREHWYKSALYAANLHQNGDSYHGDMAARNIAINSSGHVFFIDWEKGNITNQPSMDVEERFGHSWVDLKGLLLSMARPADLRHNPGIGIFKHSANWWEDFKDLFFKDYKEMRLLLAEQGSHHMKQLRETKEELEQLEHALYLEMEIQVKRFGNAEQQAA